MDNYPFGYNRMNCIKKLANRTVGLTESSTPIREKWKEEIWWCIEWCTKLVLPTDRWWANGRVSLEMSTIADCIRRRQRATQTWQVETISEPKIKRKSPFRKYIWQSSGPGLRQERGAFRCTLCAVRRTRQVSLDIRIHIRTQMLNLADLPRIFGS